MILILIKQMPEPTLEIKYWSPYKFELSTYIVQICMRKICEVKYFVHLIQPK